MFSFSPVREIPLQDNIRLHNSTARSDAFVVAANNANSLSCRYISSFAIIFFAGLNPLKPCFPRKSGENYQYEEFSQRALSLSYANILRL
jgi:hypothetical protein